VNKELIDLKEEIYKTRLQLANMIEKIKNLEKSLEKNADTSSREG